MVSCLDSEFTILPFIELGVTTDLRSVGDRHRAKPLRSSG